MKKNHITMIGILVLCILFMMVLTACQQPADPVQDEQQETIQEEDPAENNAEQEQPVDEEESHETETRFPVEKTTEISIEGMKESITLSLHDDDGLPFVIYVPEGLGVSEETGSEVNSVRLHAAFGGHINQDAFVELSIFSQVNTTIDEVRDWITGPDGLLASRETEWVQKEPEEAQTANWAMDGFAFMNDYVTGSIYIGESRGHYFTVEIHYPWEFGDGFPPRAMAAIEKTYWRNTGESLVNLQNGAGCE